MRQQPVSLSEADALSARQLDGVAVRLHTRVYLYDLRCLQAAAGLAVPDGLADAVLPGAVAVGCCCCWPELVAQVLGAAAGAEAVAAV